MRRELDLAGLQLGKIEHVVDHRQQRLTGHRDSSHAQLSLGRQAGHGVQQFGETDHPGQRRADLVAHVGQEFALGLGGRFRQRLGGHQIVLQLVTQGDVPIAGDHLGRPACRVAQDGRISLQPDVVAGLGPGAVLAPHRQIDLAAGEQTAANLCGDRDVVGVDEFEGVVADDVLRLVAVSADRGRGVADHALVIHQDDDVGGVVGQQPVARLAGAQRRLDPPTLGQRGPDRQGGGRADQQEHLHRDHLLGQVAADHHLRPVTHRGQGTGDGGGEQNAQGRAGDLHLEGHQHQGGRHQEQQRRTGLQEDACDHAGEQQKAGDVGDAPGGDGPRHAGGAQQQQRRNQHQHSQRVGQDPGHHGAHRRRVGVGQDYVQIGQREERRPDDAHGGEQTQMATALQIQARRAETAKHRRAGGDLQAVAKAEFQGGRQRVAPRQVGGQDPEQPPEQQARPVADLGAQQPHDGGGVHRPDRRHPAGLAGQLDAQPGEREQGDPQRHGVADGQRGAPPTGPNLRRPQPAG